MSRNAYGTEIKEHLLLLSIFLVLASSILIFFIGKYIPVVFGSAATHIKGVEKNTGQQSES